MIQQIQLIARKEDFFCFSHHVGARTELQFRRALADMSKTRYIHLLCTWAPPSILRVKCEICLLSFILLKE